MLVVESAGLTDVGKKRKHNEDSMLLDDKLMLFVVADGMGGHQAGEVASNLIVNTIREYMHRFHCTEEPEDSLSKAELSKDANRLISSIHLSNRVVHQFSKSKESYKGMGSTVAAVYLTDKTLIASNVGDSSIFLVRSGTIDNLSVTHTVFAEHLALGNSNETDRQFGKEFSHVLTRAMGIGEKVQPDVCEILSFKGDVVVICSDGLTDKVDSEEILHVVEGKPPGKACRALVDMANDRGGDDNVSVVVLKVKMVKDEASMGRISKIWDGFKRASLKKN